MTGETKASKRYPAIYLGKDIAPIRPHYLIFDYPPPAFEPAVVELAESALNGIPLTNIIALENFLIPLSPEDQELQQRISDEDEPNRMANLLLKDIQSSGEDDEKTEWRDYYVEVLAPFVFYAIIREMKEMVVNGLQISLRRQWKDGICNVHC